MAIVGKEDLMKAFADIVGERNDEYVTSYMENLADTMDSYNSSDDSIAKERDDYKQKYEELSERYKKRFLEPEVRPDDKNQGTIPDKEPDEPKVYKSVTEIAMENII